MVERRGNRIVRAFDEEIVFLVERVALRLVANVLEILEAKMKIAPGGENQASFESRLEFVPALLYQRGIEAVCRTRVRSSDDVRDPVFHGHFRHGAGDF